MRDGAGGVVLMSVVMGVSETVKGNRTCERWSWGRGAHVCGDECIRDRERQLHV